MSNTEPSRRKERPSLGMLRGLFGSGGMDAGSAK
jgi:hypothetical protein